MSRGAEPRLVGGAAGGLASANRRVLLGAALAVGCGAGVRAVRGQPAEQRVELVAAKFHFAPNEIRAWVGVPLLIELTSPDFVHGFAIPDLAVRVDGVPGQATRARFTPTLPGRFVFLCDNFCGEGHDRMTGTLVVSARA